MKTLTHQVLLCDYYKFLSIKLSNQCKANKNTSSLKICSNSCTDLFLYLRMTSAEPVSFTASLSPIDGPMIHHVIVVPEEVAKLFRQDKGAVRILCSIKGQAEFPCALNPRGKDYMIIASLILIRQHKLLLTVPFPVSIRTDLNNGLLLPEELEEVLEQDDWGKQLFEALLPGKKRGLIYYIRTAKSTDTRIKRALDIIEKLKNGTLHVNKSEKD